MKKYKALMLDLDGTTVQPFFGSLPSKKVIDAVAKAKDKVHVGVVSARPFYLVKSLIPHLSLAGPSIVSGGAQVIDFPSEKIIAEELISKNDVISVSRFLQNLKLNFSIEYNGRDKSTEFDLKNAQSALEIVVPEISFKKAYWLRQELKKFESIAAHVLGSWNGGENWVQISSAKATKQHAILEVAKQLKIDTHEIIGVGDSYNDFPLLMACGLKVAMGNAVQELKEIADVVAPTIEQDGVAWVIEKFVLNEK